MHVTALIPRSQDPNSIPSIRPPLGVIPNFVNPEDTSYRVFAVAGICFPLLFIFLGLRIYAKYRILESRTWDDCEYSKTTYTISVAAKKGYQMSVL